MNEHKKNTDSKHFILLGLLPIVVISGILVYAYLYLSNSVRSVPRMKIFANNAYSETIHVVTDINYEPFSYVDENGEYAGLDVELINEIANRLNVNLDFVLMDWNKAIDTIRNGEADIIMNMETDLVTPDSGLIATLPTTEKQYVVYGHESVDSVIDLYGKRVASLHQLPALELDITYVDSYQSIFEGLQSGDFDYAVCPIQVGNSFLDRLGMDDVHPSYAVGHVYGALALPADRAELRDKINSVLKCLYDEGFLSSLDRKWVNHRYEYTSVSLVIQTHPGFAMALLTGLLLLLAFALLYIIAQRRSAAAKAAYTKQLQESLEAIKAARMKAYIDELTSIRNKNAYLELADTIQVEIDHGTVEPFAIVVCDVNGLKQINDVKGHRVGDQYIKKACQILCQIYEHSPVFRIGGDEFVVILRDHDFEYRHDLIKKIEDMAAAHRQTGDVVIASGMAVYENDRTISDVFERADKEMYKNKANLKGNRE